MNWVPFLAVGDYEDTQLAVNIYDGQLCGMITTNYLQSDPALRNCITYDATQVYWRIREQAGTVVWEVNDDPANPWQELYTATPPPFPTTGVRLAIGTASVPIYPVSDNRIFRVAEFNVP